MNKMDGDELKKDPSWTVYKLPKLGCRYDKNLRNSDDLPTITAVAADCFSKRLEVGFVYIESMGIVSVNSVRDFEQIKPDAEIERIGITVFSRVKNLNKNRVVKLVFFDQIF